MTSRLRQSLVLGMTLAASLHAIPRAPAQFHSPTLQPSEARFVQQLYQQVIANQRMAEMAVNQAHTRDVRQLGANVTRDLRHSREEIRILARDKRINLSDTLTASNRRAVSHLSSTPAGLFDRVYVDTLLDHLPRALQESQQIASRARDPELRAYLNRINPLIERVIGEARTARARL